MLLYFVAEASHFFFLRNIFTLFGINTNILILFVLTIVSIYDFVYLRKKYEFEDVEYPLHNNKMYFLEQVLWHCWSFLGVWSCSLEKLMQSSQCYWLRRSALEIRWDQLMARFAEWGIYSENQSLIECVRCPSAVVGIYSAITVSKNESDF